MVDSQILLYILKVYKTGVYNGYLFGKLLIQQNKLAGNSGAVSGGRFKSTESALIYPFYLPPPYVESFLKNARILDILQQ